MSDLAPKNPEHVQSLIDLLARQAPTLADLTPEQAQAVARAVLAEDLKREMQRAVLAAKISLETEIEKFLDDVKSPHTARAYRKGLAKYKSWLTEKGLAVSEITPAHADDYIRTLRAEGKDADSVRLRVATASSFSNFISRRYPGLINPFRGTKARPVATWAVANIPSEKELEAILEAAEPDLKAVILILLETGLRVGALPELQIRAEGHYTTTSKGKRIEGTSPLTAEVLALVREAGLDLKRPFDPSQLNGRNGKTDPRTLATQVWTTRIRRHSEHLHQQGKIAEIYGPHMLRHAFAQRNLEKGIYWLKQNLNHSSIATTEHYIRNVLGRNTSRY